MTVNRALTVYLVRHGETEWNASKRFQGKLDSPLTERGRAQAIACGRALAALNLSPDFYVASPLGRTRETARIIAEIAELPSPAFDERLAEVSTGSWDGLTQFGIDNEWPGRLDGSSPFDFYFRSPDGETFEAAAKRALDWLGALEGTVVAVSHGLFGRVLRGVYARLPREKTLRLPVPQDTICCLSSGQIQAIRAAS